MTDTKAYADDRPQGLMADLDNLAVRVRRLPNTRALRVLDEMYAYYDIETPARQSDNFVEYAA